MTGLSSALVDLVLPRRCVGCGAGGHALCATCRCEDPFAVVAGAGDGTAVIAAARYANQMRRALIAYKERDRRDLAGVLGAMLAGALTVLLEQHPAPARARVVLVAPPSARSVAAARGGDHVLRLARAAVRSRRAPPNLRVGRGLLTSVRRVRDSAGLGIAERERNLAGSMVAGRQPDVRGRDRGATALVVVDDIVTTGATLRETTRALRFAGWPVLGCAVVAATPRRVTADPLAGHGRAV